MDVHLGDECSDRRLAFAAQFARSRVGAERVNFFVCGSRTWG